jgi:hypothetical protein
MMLVAQALVERGMLDSMVAGMDRVLVRLDTFVGPGNGKWVAGAIFVGLALLLLRRR